MPTDRFRAPSPPVHRASTVLFSNTAHLDEVRAGMQALDPDATMYGTFGTPTTRALESEILQREGGKGVAFAPSGLGAVALALLSATRANSHLLVPDNVYGPTREFCDGLLRRFGVETEYYLPSVGKDIAALLRPNTTAILLESPGSYTFEIQDVPAIAAAAGRHVGSPVTIVDNAWGSPGLFRPFDHGVDISVVPLTKYWGGHADLLLGAVVANDRTWAAVRATAFEMGSCTNGDDAFLALRGARSVSIRLERHQASALAVATWLTTQANVAEVLHPALPGHPEHALWKRDFHGANGLFSFALLGTNGDPASTIEVAAFVDRLVATGRFGLGYSWGGFESLVMPAVLPGGTNIVRTVARRRFGNLVRLHIGLEPVEPLIAALAAALAPPARPGTAAP